MQLLSVEAHSGFHQQARKARLQLHYLPYRQTSITQLPRALLKSTTRNLSEGDRPGEGLAVDENGDVYIAAGQVFVNDSSGRFTDMLKMPERPLQLLFGGSDGKTLFILARTSL